VHERVTEALEHRLRVLDLEDRSGVLVVAGSDEALKEQLRVHDVHDVNLGFVNRPDESEGLRNQMFAHLAQIYPDDEDDTAGLHAWGMCGHGNLLGYGTHAPKGMDRAHAHTVLSALEEGSKDSRTSKV
jgi:hypothetical protein